MLDKCPCLTRGPRGHWVAHRGRYLRLAEAARFQGMSPRNCRVVVTDRQFSAQLGNAMSVNVVERVLARALPAAGLAEELPDRWAGGQALDELKATRGCAFMR